MSKWTITKSGGGKLEDIETTVRKWPAKIDVGEPVDVDLKDTSAGTAKKVDGGKYYVHAAIWRDEFDKETGRALYVLRRDGADKAAVDAAEEMIARFFADGGVEAGEEFKPKAALVKVEKPAEVEAAAEPAEPETDEPKKLKQGTLPGMPEPDRRGELRTQIDEKRKAADAAKKEMKEAAETISEYLADHLVGDRPTIKRGTLETFVTNYRDARTKFVYATICAGNAAKELDAEERRIRKEKLS